MLMNKHIGERHGNLKILTPSNKPSNGYLYYYWCLCDCGNIKRYRYDQARKKGNCGACEDFKESGVLSALKEVKENEKE